jgi:hypothetical protein
MVKPFKSLEKQMATYPPGLIYGIQEGNKIFCRFFVESSGDGWVITVKSQK